jgi:hypothetical protein
MEYNFALIKVDWLAACIALTKSDGSCICHFPPALAYSLHNPPANGKQGPIPEEVSRTLLTNKNQMKPGQRTRC